MPCRLYAPGFVLLFATLFAAAQDADIDKKQQKFAEDALAKAGLEKPIFEEVDGFRFAGVLPKEKAQAIGKNLGKTLKAAAQLVRFKEGEKSWEGKLTIFTFADRPQYTAFVRATEERRVDPDEKSAVNVKGDSPYVVVFTGLLKSGELETKLADEVAEAVLKRKIGGVAKVPAWLTEGYSNLARLKSDGKGYTPYRTAVKAKFKGAWANAPLKEVWEPTNPKDGLLLRTSMVDYLFTGLDESKSGTVISHFRVTEENANPTLDQLMTALEWKPEQLEYNWRYWNINGKEPKEPAKTKSKK